MTEVDIDQQATNKVAFHGAIVDDIDSLRARETDTTAALRGDPMELSHHGVLNSIVHHSVAENVEFRERDESFGGEVAEEHIRKVLCLEVRKRVAVDESHVVRDRLVLIGGHRNSAGLALAPFLLQRSLEELRTTHDVVCVDKELVFLGSDDERDRVSLVEIDSEGCWLRR